MEYGIRAQRGLGSDSGGRVGPGSLGFGLGVPDSGANHHPLLAAYQLPASSAALLLNSLQNIQANAMEQLAWLQPDHCARTSVKEESETMSSEETKPDEEQRQTSRDDGDAGDEADKDERRRNEEREEVEDGDDENDEENEEVSFESWKDASIPVLSGWMLSAYATMLSRLSAATAAFEAAEGSNITSDSDSESDRSSSTDMRSRESSPSNGCVRRPKVQSLVRTTTTTTSTSTKKRRTSDLKSKKTNNANNKEQQAAASDANASDASNGSQGKKRSLALQRVRYRYEREEYRCSLCSYACTIEKAFQRHLRAHARGTACETRVSCAVCGADRSSEVDLSRHMRRHRDNRYFCCDICVFRTVQLKKLIQHRRMHTGEKPHLCPECAYRSARRDNLRSHVRRVHKKENLYCDTFSPRGMFIVPSKSQQQRPPENDDEQLEIEEESPAASPSSTPAAPSSPPSPSPCSAVQSPPNEATEACSNDEPID